MLAAAAVRHALRISTGRLPAVFAPGQRLLVGFSGGQDSTCLLHALQALRPDLALHAVHVDHALRPDATRAAAAAAASAAELGVAVDVVRVDVPAYRAALPGWSPEQAARAARYHVLASQAQLHEAAAVLVGHTADDRAETLLINLLRGAGLAGLGALRRDETLSLARLGPPPPDLHGPRAAAVRVVRPLLGVDRDTTGAYCASQSLAIVVDPTNASEAHLRNRVRHDLLPMLASFNPAIRTVLARTAELAAEDAAALDALLDEPYGRVQTAATADELTFDRAGWQALPEAIQRRLLRRALAELAGTLTDIRAAPIDDALDLVRSARPSSTYHLPYGIELRIAPRVFVLRVHGTARHRAAKSWGTAVPRV